MARQTDVRNRATQARTSKPVRGNRAPATSASAGPGQRFVNFVTDVGARAFRAQADRIEAAVLVGGLLLAGVGFVAKQVLCYA